MKYFIPESDAKEIADNLGNLNHSFEGKRILIAGCFGFLGKLFLSYFLYLNNNLLKEPCSIIGMDNFIVGNTPEEVDDNNFTLIRHDITLPLWKHIDPKRQIHWFINCSGIASPPKYQSLPIEVLRIAMEGTINVLDVAKQMQAEGVLHFGSSEYYGNPRPNEIPSSEHYASNIYSMGERAAYDQSKSLTECISDVYHRKYNVNTKLVRPFNAVNAGMALSDGRVLPAFALNLILNEKIKVHGDGSATRTMVYGTDFITGAILALIKGIPGQVYNIGGTEEISMKDLALLVQKVAGKVDMIEFVKSPKVYEQQPMRRIADLTKSKLQLGYSPKVSLEESVQRYWKWANDNWVPQSI